MSKPDKSKRSFFKKAVATGGFFSAAGYLGNLLSARLIAIDKKVNNRKFSDKINENSVSDVDMQQRTWLRKQWVPMTDNDKRQMLDEILNVHNKSET